MAHDFLGNELSIGDDAVFLNYNGTSANLERGKITRVSEHTAEISGKRRAEYKIIKVNPVKSTMDNTWIPCSERMPEDDKKVLVYIPPRDGTTQYGYYIAQMRKVKGDTNNFWGIQTADSPWTVWAWGYFVEPIVTHWQPLPEPPENGGAGNEAD